MYLNWICVFLCLVVPPFHYAITVHTGVQQQTTKSSLEVKYQTHRKGTFYGSDLLDSVNIVEEAVSLIGNVTRMYTTGSFTSPVYEESTDDHTWGKYFKGVKNQVKLLLKTCFIVNDKFNTWTRTLTTSRNNLKEPMNVE